MTVVIRTFDVAPTIIKRTMLEEARCIKFYWQESSSDLNSTPAYSHITDMGILKQASVYHDVILRYLSRMVIKLKSLQIFKGWFWIASYPRALTNCNYPIQTTIHTNRL